MISDTPESTLNSDSPLASPAPSVSQSWQTRIILSLLVGYSGYYICRSNLSIATPLLLQEFGGHGLTKHTIGMVASTGTLFYAIGKSFNGVLCDFFGGRRMFLLGMTISIFCTLIFGMGTGLSVFLAAWALNRLAGSTGWAALVKVASNWISYRQYGRIMGILSLSFLFGDALARLFLGELVNRGIGWRGVFFASAAALAVIAVVCRFALRESPREVGEPEPEVNPENLYGVKGDEHRPDSLASLLLPYFGNVSFWLVLVLSLGLNMIRDTFNNWTPTYLTEIGRVSPGTAGMMSMLFPFFGGVSVLLGGYITDRFTKGHRGGFMAATLVLMSLALVAMSELKPGTSAVIPLLLVSLVALFMMAPYAFLTGVIALDLGGKRGSSTAAGLIDSVGYFGAILSGMGIGDLADRSGWGAAFAVLAGVGLATALTAIVYWRLHDRAKVRQTSI